MCGEAERWIKMERQRGGGEEFFEWKVHETIFFHLEASLSPRGPGGALQGRYPKAGTLAWGPGSCHLRGTPAGSGKLSKTPGRIWGYRVTRSPGSEKGEGEIRKMARGQKQHLSETLFPSDLSNFPHSQPRTFSHCTPPHPAYMPTARTF